jgi:predicted unusual protein kinase regulating ubiquinone biosynthesis (AarF/ABC1/UbiB family)
MASQAAFLHRGCRTYIQKCGTNRHFLSNRLIQQPSSFKSSSIRLLQTTTQATPALSVLWETIGNHHHLHTVRPTLNIDETEEATNRILSCSPITTTDRSLVSRWLQFVRRWLKTLWRACLVTQRTTEVAVRLSPLVILAPTAYLSGSHRIAKWAWSYGVHAVQGLGPVAVKFGQWVATRRDIFPPKLCDRLAVLHDNGYPHSWDYTHRILTEAFGDYEQKGLQIEEVIGCGSAAQVYKGRLIIKEKQQQRQQQQQLYDGQESERAVAIKVLHPNFFKMVERDLELIQILADYAHSLPSDLIRMLNLPRATENFGGVLRLQADLTNEARNLQQFRFNFYKNRGDVEEQSSIAFPQPLDDWKTANVLVEDYVHDAVPIAEFLKDSTEEGLEVRRELAGPLLRAFLKMVFIDNFVHGDLHPGKSRSLLISNK